MTANIGTLIAIGLAGLAVIRAITRPTEEPPPPEESTTVPFVLGMDLSAAQNTLTGAGLAVGDLTQQADPAAAGTVIAQSPAAGSQVPLGTSVALTVSTGPAPGGFTQITGYHNQIYTVPQGETHELVGDVEFDNVSLVVEGVLRARPGVTLTFSNTNYDNYTAGQPTEPGTQVGLHLMMGGRLDFQGTPKLPFTVDGRGDDPSWRTGDELFATPHAFGSISSVPHTRGAGAPLNEYGEPAEVFNVTRDILVQGTPGANAFMMVHPDAGVSAVEYATFRYLGIPFFDSGGNQVSLGGRFSIHHHQRADRSRGELWLGCVIRDCLGHGIWPHNCHGLTFVGNIVYNVESQGIGWDLGSGANARLGNESHDGIYQDNLITDIRWTPSFRLRAQGLVLAMGLNNQIDPGNIVTGVQGSGVVWPEIGGGFTDYTPWVHNAPVKVHHCATNSVTGMGGVNVWQNPAGSVLDDFPVDVTACHVGVRIGAYVTTGYTYRIRQVRNCNIGLESHAQGGSRADGYGLRIIGEGPVQDCRVGLALEKHNGQAGAPVLYLGVPFVNCNQLIEEHSAGGAFPSRTDLVECTRDGAPLTSLLTAGQMAPSSVYDPASADPASVLRVQNGSAAFQISASGSVTAITPFLTAQQISGLR